MTDSTTFAFFSGFLIPIRGFTASFENGNEHSIFVFELDFAIDLAGKPATG